MVKDTTGLKLNLFWESETQQLYTHTKNHKRMERIPLKEKKKYINRIASYGEMFCCK